MFDAWVSQGETVVIDKPEYKWELEEFRRGKDQMVFLHIRIWKWSPSVLKDIIRNWKLFREFVTCPVYAVGGVTDTRKWERFITRFGFKYVMDVVCENGAERRLFVHIKEQENEQPVHPKHKSEH